MRKLPDHHFFKHQYFFFNLNFHSLTLSKNMNKKIKIFTISIWQWSDLECFGYLFTLKVTMKVNMLYLIFFSCRLQSKLRLSNVSYILIFSNIEIKKMSMIYRFYLRNDLHQITKAYVQIVKHEMFRWILNSL